MSITTPHAHPEVRTSASAPRSRWGGPWGLVASLALTSVVALIGGLWTDTGSDSWYARLEQPSWNPPDWLFGPVWTVLYVTMAIAAWLVVRVGGGGPAVRLGLALYVLQLALNLGWTGLFFGLERPAWALVDNVALLVAIVATAAVFAHTSRTAAAILVPYILWVSFATALTAAVVVLN